MFFEIVGAPGPHCLIAAGDVSLGSTHRMLSIAFMSSQSRWWRMHHYYVTWFVVKGILNEDDGGNLIEKERDQFHLAWVISVRQQMITAMNLNDEYFCRTLFEITIFMCLNSCDNGIQIFHFRFKTTTSTSKRQLLLGAITPDGGWNIKF